jgi:hypothetical protein
MNEVGLLLGDKVLVNRERIKGRREGQEPLLSTLLVPHWIHVMLYVQITSMSPFTSPGSLGSSLCTPE